MSNFEIAAVLVSILGVTLTIKRSMWCWIVNFIAVVMYAYLFFVVKLYGETLLQCVFMTMNIYGFYQWSKSKQQDHDIRLQHLNTKRAWIQIIVTMVLGLIFGLSLQQFTDAAVPILDGQLAMFSLLATYWTSQKHIQTWMLWVVVDIVYVGMFAYKGLIPTAGLYAIFVLLAMFGWWQWFQVLKKQRVSYF
ncbi:nicotinamide riboside transporter PnuC [Acinetobacter rudis]|uniref:Nicotinamide riboside transporter PnuC n=1 Tax=Acinetobacter rudis TaxID=632955 RepID=A0AAW8JBM4_9GAMM|nr:nicotinamide riboside transporter PnuC [Acinetobacter rudis]MDQ8936081.1 nicotinamide riboside transporter PnuC [Acinetobacter rudis]MDQ9018344.1 nicotinamide riboside transporter PnuC [Acinetobacter rudis]